MKKLLLILAICLVGCPPPSQQNPGKQEIRLQGREAARLELPANANPYIGTWRQASELWYEGYVEETHRIKREQE